jgi:cytochrome P450
MLRYTWWPLDFLEDCRRRFGDVFTIRLAGYGKLVMLVEPEPIKEVFRGDPHILHSGEGNEFLSVTVGPNSVLVLDEEPHARQRRILLPPLKGERMRSFFDEMQSTTLETIRSWPRDQPMPMLPAMQRITLRVILEAVLGLGPGPELEEFESRVRQLLGFTSQYTLILVKVLPLTLFSKLGLTPFDRCLRSLDGALFSLIDRKRRQPAAQRGENVLADLLAATHEDGTPLGDREIRDAIFTLITAGYDTTSIALAWALEQIVPHADASQAITEELKRITGGGPPRADQLTRLEYLDAAIRESMRIRTVIPFVIRLTKSPFEAGGRTYPAGVLLCPCSHLVHRREDLYPQPDSFRPERFLERKFAGHEWFPFGGGNRVCIGLAFALYEMKVVLGTLFSQVRLVRPPNSRSRPVRRGIALAPDDGAVMVVVP